MTEIICNTIEKVLVGIDIARNKHDVVVLLPIGKKERFQVHNTLQDYQKFSAYLKNFSMPCFIGLEATGNYHRPLAYFLQKEGFTICLISSLAAARTREALHNSWDKNDPKDAMVILHLMKTGVVQKYYDPLIHKINDIQEIAKTYHQISLRKVKVQHSIMNHYLPLYFPEAPKYFHNSRAQWFTNLLYEFPSPSTILKFTEEQFIEAAWTTVGRKVDKKNWLLDFYRTAKESIGLPIPEESEAIKMFRIILKEHQNLCKTRSEIEASAEAYMAQCPDYQKLKSIPGIGSIIALIILAEAGDLRRFKHYRQFLKFCGLDLSTQQSGCFKGISKLSKHGNSRLRYAFWIAATIAIRMTENTFRRKFENYVKQDTKNADLKRKGYTAVAAKMARVAYSLIKYQTDYRCFHESVIPSGKIPSARP